MTFDPDVLKGWNKRPNDWQFEVGVQRELLPRVSMNVSYGAMTALAALLVFRRLGLAFLRTAWVNLDLVWAAALVVAGALTLAL